MRAALCGLRPPMSFVEAYVAAGVIVAVLFVLLFGIPWLLRASARWRDRWIDHKRRGD